jgi:hypothetical protein
MPTLYLMCIQLRGGKVTDIGDVKCHNCQTKEALRYIGLRSGTPVCNACMFVTPRVVGRFSDIFEIKNTRRFEKECLPCLSFYIKKVMRLCAVRIE